MAGSSTLGAFLSNDDVQQVAPVTEPTETITPVAAEASAEQVIETPAPAEVATDVATAEPAVEDFSTFSLGEPTAESAATPATTTQQISWEETIKGVDPALVAKALGIDDFAIELNNHLKNGGSALDYLNARAIDYSKISDADILKQQLREQMPTATDQQLDLYIAKKYNQTEFADDDDKTFGALSMQADANVVRQRQIEKQKQFKIKEPAPQNNEETRRLQEQEAAEIQQYFDKVNSHPATQDLLSSKRVAISVGKDVPAFNVQVGDPSHITSLFSNSDEWSSALKSATGEPDVQLMNYIAVVARTKGEIFNRIFNYGKSVGARSATVDEGQNARRPIGTPANSTEVLPPTVTKKNGTFGSYLK